MLKADKERIEDAVLRTLQYYHLFKHPLTLEEICKFLTIDMQIKPLYLAVNNMVEAGLIYHYDGFYMLENNKELVVRRLAGKTRADRVMPLAERSANKVARFPFVKSVCISGSLSKGYANENSDIDLFIITSKRRLWICRSILHFYKKLTFLNGREHAYCMNYFIDESVLCLEEQNVFTATELATVIPIYNAEKYNELIQANRHWLVKTLPNVRWNMDMAMPVANRNVIRAAVETIFNILLPKYTNRFFMRLTDTWWRYKWKRKNYPMKDYDLAMKTKWYVSKNHPSNYQKKVLKQVQNPAQQEYKAVTI